MSDLTERLNAITQERIGILLPNSLGGVVRSLPLFPALSERFPDAELTAIVSKDNSGLLEGHQRVAHVIPYKRREMIHHWRPLLRELQARRFDLTIDLRGQLRTGLMSLATGASVRLGLETAREGSSFTYTDLIADSGPLVPEFVRYWRVAEALGVGHLRRVSEITIDSRTREWAIEQASTIRRPLLAIHPGADSLTKRWPVENFAVVACKAIRQYGCGVAVLGGDLEIAAGEHFVSLMQKFIPSKPVLNLVGKTSQIRLAAFLQQADCLLANDAGPLHLAASLDTPVVGLFTCTSPAISGPLGAAHELVSTCVDCHASYRICCPNRGARYLACMEELSTDRVSAAVSAVIQRQQQTRRAA
ncbi:MAG: glycosyltransferase family 9 protein [Planctomycetota bacterium]|nr:glycosyltransferase family 9 protein [Planctomycetota bacterium]MDA1164103.1 glycosyltransferase family 9 protein [Planctomycetota bacterium]